MLNVSALLVLLDDALKPTTPLTNGASFLGHPVCNNTHESNNCFID